MQNIATGIFSRLSFNQNFREVISNCQNIKQDGQDGTWITNDMRLRRIVNSMN
jgi:leucyl/phenylalanyl-tRNA--protein transferase